MEINRGKGKLYRQGSLQLVGGIDYQLHEEIATGAARWWGEFTFTESISIRESDKYVMETEDGRRGWCHLKKLVNKVVRGIPPRYVYHFNGITPLE